MRKARREATGGRLWQKRELAIITTALSGNLLMVDFIERRSQGDNRRIHQRRSHDDARRSSDRSHLVPRRLRGERRQRTGRRATD